MRRTSNLAVLFLLLRAQAFVTRNNARHGVKQAESLLNSVTPEIEKVFELEDGLQEGPDSISQLTSFLLDENKIEPGYLSEDDLEKFFPLLLSWGKTESANGAVTVQKLLERLEKEAEAGNPLASMNSRHYTVAMDAWGKSGHSNSANRAERILEKMKESIPPIAPTRVTYNTLMNAHAKHGDVRRIAKILELMEKDYRLQPITNDYNVLLGAYGKLGEARQSENVLKRMVDRCHEKGPECNCRPDLYSYNMLLDAWSKSTEPGRGKRAETILDKLCENDDLEWEPDGRTYSAAICAVARSGESNILKRIEGILSRAQSHELDSDIYLQSVLLDAYASGDSPNSARKAEELLGRLEKEGSVNAVSYNTVIKAWKSSNDPNAPAQAERIVERMKDLGLVDTISYSTLIAAHANKGDRDSAERAEAIFAEMQASGLKPNVHTLNAVMNAWIRCGQIGRAESILERMEKGFYDGEDDYDGENDVVPNVVTYTTLMNGWAKAKGPIAVEKTEAVFHRMKSMYAAGNFEARPNMFSFVTLINSIVRSGQKGAAEKAENILLEMYEQYKNGSADVKPNTKLVTSVIDCWQKSGDRDAGERAEALLNWHIDVYKVDGDESLQPNEFSFTSAISAWAKTRKFGKAAKARAILDKMIELNKSGTIHATPNTHSYTAVINSCAFCENDAFEKREALRIAITTYKELLASEYGRPNHVTFSTVITAIRNLMPACEKRAAAVKTIFRTCAEDGQVSEFVLRRLMSTLDKDQMGDLVEADAFSADGRIDISRIPTEWKRNARKNLS